jgi:hypothetical protein
LESQLRILIVVTIGATTSIAIQLLSRHSHIMTIDASNPVEVRVRIDFERSRLAAESIELFFVTVGALDPLGAIGQVTFGVALLTG